MKDCGLMPCEVEHGFNAQGHQTKVLRSRTQWKALGRVVVVDNSEAVRCIPMSGHKLYLFEVSQTEGI
jgi:hypothetical protein